MKTPRPSAERLKEIRDEAHGYNTVPSGRIRELIAEIDGLDSERAIWKLAAETSDKQREAWIHKFEEIKAYAGKLRGALEYYAHPDHYTHTVRLRGSRIHGVLTDGGQTAREALSIPVPGEGK